ncbi:MAG: serine/threonine protein kinase [bacterium]|nr:serine/threonine protein kinase [bacterium]
MPDRDESTESRIEELFHALLELPPAQRETYLAAQAGIDDDTRQQVLEMIAIADDQPDLLEPPVEPPAPERLGKYEILAETGRGGMGVVYRARDTQLGRDVAVKVLPERLARDAQSLERFEREARLLGALSNENIATLYSLEVDGGVRFLTMEFVEGRTLAAVLREGALPIDRALQIGRQTARALAAAHVRHIVHRDLKPSNIMITPEGLAKVLDFGIAKALGAAPEGLTSAVAAHGPLTTTLGTPGYMSPEQLRGGMVDHRADIWAFGCLLYECLTGVRAVPAGATVPATGEDFPVPDLTRLPDGLPTGIRSLLEGCLAIDPERRLDSCAAICETLENIRVSGGTAGRRRLRPVGLALVAVTVLLAGYFVGKALTDGGADQPALAGASTAESARTALADLTITTTPAAAAVTINGRYLGRTPLREQVPGGDVVVRAEMPGYATVVESLVLKAGDGVERMFTLVELTGDLLVESEPAGAVIILDSRRLEAVTPQRITALPVRQAHTLRLELAGYRPADLGVVEVVADSLLSMRHRFELTTHPLAVYSKPTGATVVVDGDTVGITPSRLPALPRGAHQLTLQLAGHVSQHRPFVVPDDGAALEITLAPLPPGQLDLRIVPFADVWIDGAKQAASTSYFTGQFAPGRHVVELRHPVYAAVVDTVVVVSGETAKIPYTLSNGRSE